MGFMRFAVAHIIILGILGVAVFGFFAMNHDDCIAVFSRAADCPVGANGIAFLNFHADALKGFLTAVVRDFSSALTLGMLAAVAVLFLRGFFSDAARIAPLFYRARFQLIIALPSQNRLARWLALHENSPAIS